MGFRVVVPSGTRHPRVPAVAAVFPTRASTVRAAMPMPFLA